MAGRPLTGSFSDRGGVCDASVPRRRGEKPRVHATFVSRAAAEPWVAAQVERLNEGLEADEPVVGTPGYLPAPARVARAARAASVAARPAAAPDCGFEYWARRWHRERYIALHRADAERTEELMRDMETHLFPVFGGPLEVGSVEERRDKVVSWVRTMAGYDPLPDAPSFPPPARRYSEKTVKALLWALSEVLLYAHTLGADVPVIMTPQGSKPAETAGIQAMKKRGGAKRTARLMSMEATREIASDLHVVYQLVLWLMRVAGLRIGEAYGLVVANFIDDGERALLLIEAQGGRTYRLRDDDERTVTTRRKARTKTEAGFRLIVVPGPLAAIVRIVIAAWHTDPVTGDIDGQARLVPTIQADGGGQGGFRSALKAVARKLVGASGDPDDYVIPHDARKGFADDLAWDPTLHDLVKRKAMGHRAGSDVFDLIYTLDDRLAEMMVPAAKRIEAEIAATIGTLVVPTVRRPNYRADRCKVRAAHIDAELARAGWQVDDDGSGEWVGTAEAAAVLGMSETATRRLFPDQIAAEKSPAGDWRVRLGDVIAYRERHRGSVYLQAVAHRAERSYHQAYQMLGRLDISSEVDPYTRQLLLTSEQADAVVAEFARIDRLHERAVPVAVACAELNLKHPSVHGLIRSGRLQADSETDTSGRLFISTASLVAEKATRKPASVPVVRAGELATLAGVARSDLTALARAGRLTSVRRVGYTLESALAWAAADRPELVGVLTKPAQ